MQSYVKCNVFLEGRNIYHHVILPLQNSGVSKKSLGTSLSGPFFPDNEQGDAEVEGTSAALQKVSSLSLCRTTTLEIPFRCRTEGDEQVDSIIVDKSSLSTASMAKSEVRVESSFLSMRYS